MIDHNLRIFSLILENSENIPLQPQISRTLVGISFRFLSNRKKYNSSDSFPFDYVRNGISLFS